MNSTSQGQSPALLYLSPDLLSNLKKDNSGGTEVPHLQFSFVLGVTSRTLHGKKSKPMFSLYVALFCNPPNTPHQSKTTSCHGPAPTAGLRALTPKQFPPRFYIACNNADNREENQRRIIPRFEALLWGQKLSEEQHIADSEPWKSICVQTGRLHHPNAAFHCSSISQVTL